eukprot:jgi/Bigna1/60903/fgenesh1_kg.16_\
MTMVFARCCRGISPSSRHQAFRSGLSSPLLEDDAAAAAFGSRNLNEDTKNNDEHDLENRQGGMQGGHEVDNDDNEVDYYLGQAITRHMALEEKTGSCGELLSVVLLVRHNPILFLIHKMDHQKYRRRLHTRCEILYICGQYSGFYNDSC